MFPYTVVSEKWAARLSANQNLCWCVETALLFRGCRETAFWMQIGAQSCIRPQPNHDHRDPGIGVLKSGMRNDSKEALDEELRRQSNDMLKHDWIGRQS